MLLSSFTSWHLCTQHRMNLLLGTCPWCLWYPSQASLCCRVLHLTKFTLSVFCPWHLTGKEGTIMEGSWELVHEIFPLELLKQVCLLTWLAPASPGVLSELLGSLLILDMAWQLSHSLCCHPSLWAGTMAQSHIPAACLKVFMVVFMSLLQHWYLPLPVLPPPVIVWEKLRFTLWALEQMVCI